MAAARIRPTDCRIDATAMRELLRCQDEDRESLPDARFVDSAIRVAIALASQRLADECEGLAGR
jgi:hypothetical protein